MLLNVLSHWCHGLSSPSSHHRQRQPPLNDSESASAGSCFKVMCRASINSKPDRKIYPHVYEAYAPYDPLKGVKQFSHMKNCKLNWIWASNKNNNKKLLGLKLNLRENLIGISVFIKSRKNTFSSFGNILKFSIYVFSLSSLSPFSFSFCYKLSFSVSFIFRHFFPVYIFRTLLTLFAISPICIAGLCRTRHESVKIISC